MDGERRIFAVANVRLTFSVDVGEDSSPNQEIADLLCDVLEDALRAYPELLWEHLIEPTVEAKAVVTSRSIP